MKTASDPELLRRFAKTQSEEAFAELVHRHIDLVHSAAIRLVGGDAHLAQDVAQSVFADLARKAGCLSLRGSLTGWLYTGTHFAASKAVRSERRRRAREEAFMREPNNDPDLEADWESVRPLLDDVMHELQEVDREAILLRHFENRPFIEVGARLGLSENAARMRVERALDKLRSLLARRGIATSAGLSTVISTHAVQLDPANLAPMTLAASATAAKTGGILTLAKIMTATKLKLGFGLLVAAGATTALVIQHQTHDRLRAENDSLRQQVTTLKAENETFFTKYGEPGVPREVYDRLFTDPVKSNYLSGMEVVSLGEATNSFGPNMWFVPYKVRFKDGTVKEFRLHVAQDTKTQRWYFKGGF